MPRTPPKSPAKTSVKSPAKSLTSLPPKPALPAGGATHGSASAGDPYLPGNGNGGYLALHYDLDLDYRVSTNQLRGTATMTGLASMSLDRFCLDFDGLTVDRVTVDGVRAQKVSQNSRKLTITVATTIEAGERFEVTVRYRGTPHPLKSIWGEVGWEELDDGVLVAGQPTGAASWFPCNDHPSNKASFRIRVSCEDPYTVVSNGALIARTTRSGRTSWTYEVKEPMATYLATVLIGRYRRADVVAAPVAQRIFFPANLAREVAVDFARLPEMISLFDRLFGTYPFGGYSVVVTDDELEIPLEAHGLAIFGRNHVDGVHGSDRLIAHELAHQWFGNSLTVSRWQDIWLHEGFACYAEWLWAEASGGLSADASAAVHRAEIEALPSDIVVGDPGPHDMFDDRVYKRGALALHALRRSLGDEVFFGAVRAYTRARHHGSVSTEDLVEFFTVQTDSSDIRRIVDRWIYRTALPKL
ncbi:MULTISPECIES: M1 family metallopeptidase [Cryobacterium]|uniref:Aminopeptidase N n=1 Tax=Cryobacterium breve TaxID=1259258 RepID=A0ABY2J6X1_9MICO|nr:MULTISPECIES: M1 family metallopeptidase [Cryobacterium]TFC96306.1 M1 family peptidase [Cryobacterium sp. TmT3-12]TFD00689.1 M1 family peptidase [Cryobacterium breve]